MPVWVARGEFGELVLPIQLEEVVLEGQCAAAEGKHFCVVTGRGHVALLTLTKATWKSDHPERRALTFTVQRWLKT